jgi:sulfide dehydrogenase cytochrome subunit
MRGFARVDGLVALWLMLGSIAAGVQALEPQTARPRPAMLAHACAGCHGTFGHGQAGTPVIAGMPETEFVRIMRAFKSGQRRSSVMNRIAQGYRDEDFIVLARFFRSR